MDRPQVKIFYSPFPVWKGTWRESGPGEQEELEIREHGFLGDFRQGKFAINLCFPARGYYAFDVDAKKNVVRRTTEQVDPHTKSCWQYVPVFIHAATRNAHTVGASNHIRLASVARDGLGAIEKIGIVAQDDKFYLVWQTAFLFQLYRKSKDTVISPEPPIERWPSFLSFLGQEMETLANLQYLPGDPSQRKIMRPTAERNGLPPDHGRVVYFDEIDQVGAISLSDGVAKAYWGDIKFPRQGGRRFLRRNEVVKFNSLLPPCLGKDVEMKTTYRLEAKEIEVVP